MRVEFLAKGDFIVCVNNTDEYHFKKLDDAFSYVENEVEDGVGNEVDIIDGETGEIIACCYDDKFDEPFFDKDFEIDEDFETGFNPYLGTFDWDC